MELSISRAVLATLVCPASGRPLGLATEEEARRWTAETTFDGVLLTEGGEHAYPIRKGFPILVTSERLVFVKSEKGR